MDRKMDKSDKFCNEINFFFFFYLFSLKEIIIKFRPFDWNKHIF